MFAFILVGYFIGFELSYNIVPSSYILEFQISKNILWSLDLEVFFTEEQMQFYDYAGKLVSNYRSYLDIELSLPFRIIFKEKKVKNFDLFLLFKISPYYRFENEKSKASQPNKEQITTNRLWQTGLRFGISSDLPIRIKEFAFKVRGDVSFLNLYYQESNQYIPPGLQKRFSREFHTYSYLPLKGGLGIYLIFEF